MHPGTLKAKLTLSLATVLLILLAMEAGLRIIKGKLFEFENQCIRKSTILKHYYPVMFDTRLGWAPKPGDRAGNELWINREVTILGNGLRSNGPGQPTKERPVVLVAGDSFAFGDEVSDHETWAALLEQWSGVPVLNGGVFGYGLDQAYLRALTLVEEHHPQILIFQFAGDDITRCALSVRGNAPKPYFELRDGVLSARTDHIRPLTDYEKRFTWFQRVFGYSFLVHSLMIRVNPAAWSAGQGGTQLTGEKGYPIAEALVDDLATWPSRRQIKVLLLNTDRAPGREAEQLLARATGLGLPTARVDERFRQAAAGDPRGEKALLAPGGHFSPEGYRLVAERVLEEMVRQGWVPAGDLE